ncbi:MAG: hypothetical protein Q9195_004967 [Heterodermia aff. obscurata]
MAGVVTISVDGQDGELVARNNGLYAASRDSDFDRVNRDESRDGSPGIHALQATPGAPAGFLAIELSESTFTEEGITVHRVGFTSRQEPPEWVEVPARKNLKVSAVGGRAESGHLGGNGQNGMNGIDGNPATREVDATVRHDYVYNTLGPS